MLTLLSKPLDPNVDDEGAHVVAVRQTTQVSARCSRMSVSHQDAVTGLPFHSNPQSTESCARKRNQARNPQLNVGSFSRSSLGIDSKWPPAFRHAVKPPTITNALKPFSCSRCATRALVASRAQVQ